MTTLNFSIDFTEQQLIGIAQARTKFNSGLPEQSNPLTDLEYLTKVIIGAADSYASQYSGTSPVEPSPVASLTRRIDARRLRLALNQLGLLATVESAIAGLDQAAQIDWKYATIIKADNSLVTSLSTSLMIDIDTVLDLAETFL